MANGRRKTGGCAVFGRFKHPLRGFLKWLCSNATVSKIENIFNFFSKRGRQRIEISLSCSG